MCVRNAITSINDDMYNGFDTVWSNYRPTIDDGTPSQACTSITRYVQVSGRWVFAKIYLSNARQAATRIQTVSQRIGQCVFHFICTGFNIIFSALLFAQTHVWGSSGENIEVNTPPENNNKCPSILTLIEHVLLCVPRYERNDMRLISSCSLHVGFSHVVIFLGSIFHQIS